MIFFQLFFQGSEKTTVGYQVTLSCSQGNDFFMSINYSEKLRDFNYLIQGAKQFASCHFIIFRQYLKNHMHFCLCRLQKMKKHSLFIDRTQIIEIQKQGAEEKIAIHFGWRRKWQPIPVFLPGEFHGQRSLVGYSPWGCKESDMTDRFTHTHTHTFWYHL